VIAAVRTSVRLSELADAADVSCAALDRCRQPLVLVDGAAHVRFANRAAEALLRAADGFALEHELGDRRGRLRAATPTATAALRRAIATAAALAPRPERAKGDPDVPPHPTALVIDRPSGRPALAVLAVPLRGARAVCADAVQWGGAGATVALFISDPIVETADADDSLRDRLRAVYRLTPAESTVAVALAEGNGLAAVATVQRVTLATVRTHAQHVYRKTGVRGQAALARLVERLAQVG
jgi:DNA-binding CsgD family transcriptional regulator